MSGASLVSAALSIDGWRTLIPKSPYDPGVVDVRGVRVCSCFGAREAAIEHANLIAALPALLAALRTLHAVCVNMDADIQAERPTEEAYQAAMTQAEAALLATRQA